jgi:hypothetical protein
MKAASAKSIQSTMKAMKKTTLVDGFRLPVSGLY